MKPRVTIERLKEVLRYDPQTGVFVWLRTLSARAPRGTVAGTHTKRGCLVIGIDGLQYKAHHLAWFYVTGHWPAQEIDHRDTDPTNNRWLNLRDVTHRVNSQNHRRPRTTNKTGLLGVHLCKQTGRYRAAITTDGRVRQLGRFVTPELAHEAYVQAKRQLHEGCTL